MISRRDVWTRSHDWSKYIHPTNSKLPLSKSPSNYLFFNLKTLCTLRGKPFAFKLSVFCSNLTAASDQQASTAVASLGTKGLLSTMLENLQAHSTLCSLSVLWLGTEVRLPAGHTVTLAWTVTRCQYQLARWLSSDVRSDCLLRRPYLTDPPTPTYLSKFGFRMCSVPERSPSGLRT